MRKKLDWSPLKVHLSLIQTIPIDFILIGANKTLFISEKVCPSQKSLISRAVKECAKYFFHAVFGLNTLYLDFVYDILNSATLTSKKFFSIVGLILWEVEAELFSKSLNHQTLEGLRRTTTDVKKCEVY